MKAVLGMSLLAGFYSAYGMRDGGTCRAVLDASRLPLAKWQLPSGNRAAFVAVVTVNGRITRLETLDASKHYLGSVSQPDEDSQRLVSKSLREQGTECGL